MLKTAKYVAVAYAGAVLATKELERRGALSCDCPEDCWCHRPGLSLFRWTVPVAHGGRG